MMNVAAAAPEPFPQRFRDIVDLIQRDHLILVIQKTLTSIDVIPNHNRLSMPLTMIFTQNFLTQDEKQSLNEGQIIHVSMIGPDLQEVNLRLRQWNMPHGSISCYILSTGWNEIAANNGLRQGDVIQVWSFRAGGGLYMALVRVNGN